jgi:hypothetical protein
MQRDRYTPFSDSTRETYEFLSYSPKGTIKKVVQYIANRKGVYNLGFGDWDEQALTIRDDVRTNNEDRDKVLATVAYTLVESCITLVTLN